MNLKDALNLAIQRHQAGQLADAQTIYRQILSVDPNHSDALHLLGAAALQRGAPAEAEAPIRHAIVVSPNVPDYYVTLGVVLDALDRMEEAVSAMRRAVDLDARRPEVLTNLGNALRKAGKLEESIQVCRRALVLRPDYPSACLNLGLALRELSVRRRPDLLDEAIHTLRKASILAPRELQALLQLAIALGQKKEYDQSLDCCRRALAINPASAEAHNVMGSIYREMGDLEKAVAESRQAIALRMNFHEAYLYLGMALRDMGKLEEAAAAFRAAIGLRPKNADSHNALGHVLCTLGRYTESEAACRLSLALQPDFDEANNNLGLALQGLSRWHEAIAAHEAALKVRPDFTEAHNNLGIAYAAIGRHDAARKSLDAALKIRPDYPSAHWNLALRLLSHGDYQRGWPEYEWRRRVPEFRLRADFPRPQWDGSYLNGRKILIHNEQGFGDAIQFLRFLPLVAKRGGRIILACQDSLRRLCNRIEGVDQCVGLNEFDAEYDVHCPLMSLGGVFNTSVQTIPTTIPYLSVEPEWIEPWRSRIPNDGRRKIGFLWANKPNPANRCPPPSAWSPIAQVPSAWFCSLQKESRVPPPGVDVTDWTDELNDFADTAALIENLDLIVTVDTAVAHLAGALGKPVWMLLKFAPDWRWMLDRPDSPWYPTMRLFRQPTLTDWDTPIQQIVAELTKPTHSA